MKIYMIDDNIQHAQALQNVLEQRGEKFRIAIGNIDHFNLLPSVGTEVVELSFEASLQNETSLIVIITKTKGSMSDL
jgi:hypothetical protein